MKLLIISALLLSSSLALAESTFVELKGNVVKEITQFEAIKLAIATDNKANIQKCTPQELTSKGKFRAK